MKVSWVKMLGAWVAGLMTTIAVPALAQLSVTANGPYYATPSWDQKLTTNRFVVLANWNSEAVLDRETGLVWERIPTTVMYPAAGPPQSFGVPTHFQHCVALEVANRSGWRVPSVQELRSLVDSTQSQPALPAGHPFVLNLPPFTGSNSDAFRFWTATVYGNEVGPAFRYVQLLDGRGGIASVAFLARVWCVRGGAGSPIQ